MRELTCNQFRQLPCDPDPGRFGVAAVPVLVVNKPGAGGALGTSVVAAAKPDGFTLLLALASISTNPEQERLNKRPAPFQLTSSHRWPGFPWRK